MSIIFFYMSPGNELLLILAIYDTHFNTKICLQKNSTKFDNKITSHYYEFNPSNPMWKYFDVTSCLAQFDKLYLKITLDGKQKLKLPNKYMLLFDLQKKIELPFLFSQ